MSGNFFRRVPSAAMMLRLTAGGGGRIGVDGAARPACPPKPWRRREIALTEMVSPRRCRGSWWADVGRRWRPRSSPRRPGRRWLQPTKAGSAAGRPAKWRRGAVGAHLVAFEMMRHRAVGGAEERDRAGGGGRPPSGRNPATKPGRTHTVFERGRPVFGEFHAAGLSEAGLKRREIRLARSRFLPMKTSVFSRGSGPQGRSNLASKSMWTP